jgi:single-strand DNA-binding protein
VSAPITLTGRLGKDPALRFSASGTPVASFSIVTSRRSKDEQGNWTDADTTWWDCTAFRSLAENAAASLAQGMPVIAVGRIVQENWEDKQTGQKRSKLAVRLDGIGPDLNRATARVEKTNGQAQQGGQARQNRPAQDDPWASSTPSQDSWGAAPQSHDRPPF